MHNFCESDLSKKSTHNTYAYGFNSYNDPELTEMKFYNIIHMRSKYDLFNSICLHI